MSASADGLRARLTGGIEGIFVKLASLETLEIAAARFDFCVVDLEHSQLGEREALGLLAHARALGFPALLRIPVLDRALVNRALEAGACGIQLSNVRSAAEVEAAREASAFPPRGHRSVSTAQPAAGYGRTGLRAYVEGAERCLLVVQIEDATSDDPLEDILAAGADVAFVGTSDLSVVVGFDGVRLERRIAEVRAAATAAGVALGAFGDAGEDVRYRIGCSDLSLFASATAAWAASAAAPAQAIAACVARFADIPDEPVRPGIRRRGFGSEGCLLVLNTCAPGMEVRPHAHDFDQVALILSGHGRFHVGEEGHPVGPGSALFIPAGVTHCIEPDDEVIENLDIFAPARTDYLHLIEWMRPAADRGVPPPLPSDAAETEGGRA